MKRTRRWRITSDYEILVVDDGSTDRTRELAEREARRRPTVRVLGFDRNRGYGAALQTGFEAAKKDYIGFTDADCQFDLSELSRLVLLLASCDIACGYRINRQDGWLRGLYSKIYNFLVRCMLGTQAARLRLRTQAVSPPGVRRFVSAFQRISGQCRVTEQSQFARPESHRSGCEPSAETAWREHGVGMAYDTCVCGVGSLLVDDDFVPIARLAAFENSRRLATE